MNKAAVTTTLVTLLFTSGVKAADVTINWQATGTAIGMGYLPKSASDGLVNVVTIGEVGNGMSALESQVGSYSALTIPPSVSWARSFNFLYHPYQTTPQVGHSPSVALVLQGAYPNAENALEVHQGGQENQSALWFQLGSNSGRSTGINWLASNRYGKGYNPTVAIDRNSPSSTTATVVEVHQAAVGESALLYHVGTLTLGTSPSMSPNWSTALEINAGMNRGYAPTISIANNVAVLVAQGTGGALWYAIGVVDTTASEIAWTKPIPYSTSGYNPTVSVYGGGLYPLAGPRVVVEAHQAENGTGQLTYRTGILKNGADGSAPTTVTWTPDSDTPFSTGCYPSVALAFYESTPSNLSLTETHETACGTVTTVVSSFGLLSKR